MNIDQDSLANFNSIIAGQANVWNNTFADLDRQRQQTLAAVEEANALKRDAEEAQIKMHSIRQRLTTKLIR